MKKIIFILIIAGGWHVSKYGWPDLILNFSSPATSNSSRSTAPAEPVALESNTPVTTSNFLCDGRTYCSQMTSCAEAKFFLNNCPNTKMDGDGNGIPCERQWCR